MVTIGKVKEVEKAAAFDAEIYGATAEFLGECGRLLQAIGDAVCQSQGLSAEAAKALPDDTVLSGDALARYEEWRNFLLRHDPSLTI